MGRKGNWFSSVKKAFSPGSKDKKAKKENKSQKQLFEKENPSVSDSPAQEIIVETSTNNPLPTPLVEDAKFTEVEDEHTKQVAATTSTTTTTAAEAAVEVVQRTQFAGKSKEEVSAIKIQTAFRGHLARRALRALRGLVRLKTLVDGPTVKRQTANTLKCMQTLSRVQSQIQSRRLRMLEENHALQRQLLQKRAKELESLRMGEEWDDSARSKEQVEANLLHKYEAAMRRERALAYSYTHQQTWKKSTRSPNLLFMDPTNPHWGWSWLERWMSVHPWENQTAAPEKDHPNAPLKSSTGNNREIAKSFARHQLNSETNNPSSPMSVKNNSPSTTPSKSSARKAKPPSPRGNSVASQDDDSRSVFSVQSEKISRRHSVAGGGAGGSTIRDDESLASSPSVPGYMTPTRSAKAKSKLPSPLGAQNGGSGSDKGSATKKRLSYPPSPARARRHSMPPKVETSAVVEGDVNGVAC